MVNSLYSNEWNSKRFTALAARKAWAGTVTNILQIKEWARS